MRVKTSMQLLGQLKQLTPRQRKLLAHHLDSPSPTPAAVFPETISIPEHCPYCQAQANQVGKWGNSHGLSHYRYKACGSRLKGWMRCFHGVATKYLEDYLDWLWMIERYKNTINPAVCLSEALGRPVMQQLI